MRSVCLAGGRFPEQTDLRKDPFAPLGRRIRPSDVRFRVVPAHPELVQTFRSVSHPSPSDKVSTGAAASDVAQDRGPVARRGDHESGIASGRYRAGVKRVRQPQPIHRNAQLTWC